MGVEDEEADWIRRSREGDPEAFGSLVARYQQMVHALAYRMTGSLEDAEDLAQEAFVRAYQRLDTFRAEARFSSWLGRIVIRLSLDWTARGRRRQALHKAWAAEGTVHPAVDPPAVETGDDTRRVERALLRLPAKQRAAVVLTVHEGLSHAESAVVLGCSETTVSWRLFAARAKLKRWLRT